jgi:CO dehydrogenase nickel-insertion accessory protein CooC1
MAMDLGIKTLYVVVNKIKTSGEEKLVREKLADFNVLGIMPYSESVRMSDLKQIQPCEADKIFAQKIEEIALKLQGFMIESNKISEQT